MTIACRCDGRTDLRKRRNNALLPEQIAQSVCQLARRRGKREPVLGVALRSVAEEVALEERELTTFTHVEQHVREPLVSREITNPHRAKDALQQTVVEVQLRPIAGPPAVEPGLR